MNLRRTREDQGQGAREDNHGEPGRNRGGIREDQGEPESHHKAKGAGRTMDDQGEPEWGTRGPREDQGAAIATSNLICD